MRCIVMSIFGALFLFGAAGCTVEKTWAQAERATYNVVAPAHRKYVVADKEMTSEQKELRLLLLETWEARIKEHEKETE